MVASTVKMATTVYQRKIGDADQDSDGRYFSIEGLYNRESIDDDQWFDCHILGSVDHPQEHPTGTQEPTTSSSDWNSGDRNAPITAVKKQPITAEHRASQGYT